MRVIIIISLLILIVSCSGNDSNKIELTTSIDTNAFSNTMPSFESHPSFEIEDSVLSTNNLNTFKDLYLLKFSIDSLFQIKYTVFPIRERGYERNMETDEETHYEKISHLKDWRKVDFRYDSSAYYQEYDKYIQTFERIGEDTIKVKYQGVDNGIYCGYTFAKDSVWKLVYTWDYSN